MPGILARLGIDASDFTETLDNVSKKIDGLSTKTFKEFAFGVGQAFSAKAVIDFTMAALEAAGKIADASKQLKISSETYQTLDVFAKKAGLSVEDFSGVIERLTKQQAEAVTGGKEQVKAFAALGISISELQTLNPEELFKRVTAAMANGKGTAEEQAAAFDLLGRGSARLMSSLKELGTTGVDALTESYKKLGWVMSNEVVDSLDYANDAIEDIKRTVTGFAKDVVALVPMLSAAVAKLIYTEELDAEQLEIIRKGEEARLELQKKQNVEALLQKQAKEAQAAAEKAIVDISKEMKALRESHLKLSQEILSDTDMAKKLEQEILAIEEDLNDLSKLGVRSTKETVALEQQIVDKRLALKEVNARLHQDRMRQEDEWQKSIMSYADYMAKKWFEGLGQQEKITELRTRLWEVEERIKATLDTQGMSAEEQLENDARQAQLLQRKAELNDQINDLMNTQVKAGDELTEIWNGLTSDQAGALISLRDALADMSDEEIERFLNTLKTLATRLSELPPVPPQLKELATSLAAISGFRLPPAFTSNQGKDLGDAMTAFANALAPGVAEIGKLDLTPLTTLSGFKLPSAMTSSQMKGIATALNAFTSNLNKADMAAVGALDFSFLAKLSGFKLPGLDKQKAKDFAESMNTILGVFKNANVTAITALTDLFKSAKGGKIEVEVTLPAGGIPDSIPITMPSGFDLSGSGLATEGTLQAIQSKIDSIEGIKWA